MAELYSPDTIRKQSGYDLMREVEGMDPAHIEQLWEAVIELLKSDHAQGLPR